MYVSQLFWSEMQMSRVALSPDVVACPRANRSPRLDCLHSSIFSRNRRDILSRYSASDCEQSNRRLQVKILLLDHFSD